MLLEMVDLCQKKIDFWLVDLLAAAQQQTINVCIMYLLLYHLMIVTVLAGGNAVPLTNRAIFACQLAVICNATFPRVGLWVTLIWRSRIIVRVWFMNQSRTIKK